MKKRFLRDIAEIQTGPFGSQLHKEDYVDVGTPIVTVEHLGSRVFSEQNLPMVSDTDKRRLSKYILNKGDIVFSRVGSVDRCSFVDQKHDGWMFSGRCLRVRPSEKVDSMFLYYFFCLNTTKEFVRSIAVGATMPSINTKLLGDVEVVCPEIEEQRKIADILSKIDDKIEENLKINENLLNQALTLYATQFSSLELNGCIGDYCSVKSGFAFKSSWWTNCGVRVIKIGSINQDNLNLLECSYVDEDKADKAKDFVVKAGDLLIAMTGATIGKFAMVPYSSEVLLVNQRVGKFFLGNNPVEKLPFIYCTLKQPEVYGEVVNRGQGSAQPNISASDIMSIPCVIPSQDAINDFNDTSQPLFDLIISNQQENQQLSELRNVLLPKLMSGELDVSVIDL